MSRYKVTLGKYLWKRQFQPNPYVMTLDSLCCSGKDNRPQNQRNGEQNDNLYDIGSAPVTKSEAK